MTIEQIFELEPRLKNIVPYVNGMNHKAKKNTVYWYDVWVEVKKKMDGLVGWSAEKEELRNGRAYNACQNYFESLATNCK